MFCFCPEPIDRFRSKDYAKWWGWWWWYCYNGSEDLVLESRHSTDGQSGFRFSLWANQALYKSSSSPNKTIPRSSKIKVLLFVDGPTPDDFNELIFFLYLVPIWTETISRSDWRQRACIGGTIWTTPSLIGKTYHRGFHCSNRTVSRLKLINTAGLRCCPSSWYEIANFWRM